MNVSLTPELEELISRKVESGLYSSASEVVREALRLLQQRDEQREAMLEELRKKIQVGIEQVERGEVVPWDLEEFKKQARKRLEEGGDAHRHSRRAGQRGRV